MDKNVSTLNCKTKEGSSPPAPQDWIGLKDFLLDNQWKTCVLGTVNWRQSGSKDIFRDNNPLNTLKKYLQHQGAVKFVQETPKIL